MAYLETNEVQSWLQETKHRIATVDAGLERAAAQAVLGKLGQRYDTSTWLDQATTPELVRSIISMMVASYVLRRSISEDLGEATYPDWLEGRAQALCDGIVDGSIELSDATEDPTSSLGAGAEHYPTDVSTTLYDTDPTSDDATPLVFHMNTTF